MHNTAVDNHKQYFAQEYYSRSIQHRNVHKCGGYPYADGAFLNQIVKHLGINSVLEIGTAIGYSAYCFAADNDVDVTTIDMVDEHRDIAEKNWAQLDVSNKVTMLIGNSIDLLPEINQFFDIIFFDGFAPNPLEAKHYARLIGTNGILISTNLSWNQTTSQYLSNLENASLKNELFDDTALSSRDNNVLNQSVQLWRDLKDI